MQIFGKVTASTLAAGISGYVLDVLSEWLDLDIPKFVNGLIVAAILAALVFVAGYLKREHVLPDTWYASFVPDDVGEDSSPSEAAWEAAVGVLGGEGADDDESAGDEALGDSDEDDDEDV